MRERKFTADEIRDVVFALVGDTGIYGETYADAKNTENIKTLFDVTYDLVERIGEVASISCNGEGSIVEAKKQSANFLQRLKEECEDRLEEAEEEAEQ